MQHSTKAKETHQAGVLTNADKERACGSRIRILVCWLPDVQPEPKRKQCRIGDATCALYLLAADVSEFQLGGTVSFGKVRAEMGQPGF